MNEQTQAMCFMAGANSIFYGCKLLTTPNPEEDKDLQLFRKLGLNPQQTAVLAGDNEQQQRLEQALMRSEERRVGKECRGGRARGEDDGKRGHKRRRMRV